MPFAPQAFTRVTQQDPEHGEAWNNIAAIWVQLDRNKEAFSALGECVKHKRDSWQVKRAQGMDEDCRRELKIAYI